MHKIELGIGEIFDLSIKTNGSFLTKTFVESNKGEVPIYSASSNPDDEGYGFIKDNIQGVRYFENCLTWNIDGSFSRPVYRKSRFSLSEKVIPLVIREKFIGSLDERYLSFQIYLSSLKEGFSFRKKAGKTRIENLKISLPLTKDGNFDISAQKEFVNKIEKINSLKAEISEMIEGIQNKEISLEHQYDGNSFRLKELFDLKQGNAFYTKKRILENGWLGDVPVYSSNTKNDGELIRIARGKIVDGDLFFQNCLTWSVDGYAGKIFIRNQDNTENNPKPDFFFTINNHSGVMIPKCVNMHLPFFAKQLQPKFFEKIKGYGICKLGSNQIEDILVSVPLDAHGNFDIEKQKEIAEKSEQVHKLKGDMLNELRYLEKVAVEV